MESFIVRVAAHYGEPKVLGTVPCCSGIVLDTPIESKDVVNALKDFESQADVYDNAACGGRSDYTLDRLVADFQDEYGCKVNIEVEPHVTKSGLVYEFDIFEPNWPEKDEAEDVINDLTRRIVDFVNGYPTGR